jgi:hypothetical protein
MNYQLYVFRILVSGQQLDCPAGWMSNRYDPRWPCYLITNKIQRTWSEAQTFCEQMGGGLWKINTVQEKVIMKRNLNSRMSIITETIINTKRTINRLQNIQFRFTDFTKKLKYEPRHDKTNIVRMRPAWIQTSLRIRAV